MSLHSFNAGLFWFWFLILVRYLFVVAGKVQRADLERLERMRRRFYTSRPRTVQGFNIGEQTVKEQKHKTYEVRAE